MNLSRKALFMGIGIAAVSAAAISGATYALLSSGVTSESELRKAGFFFAVNGATATGEDAVVEYPLGLEAENALVADEHLAIPLSIDALAQGNAGLRYTVELPQFPEGSVFDYSNVSVFPVDDAAECTVSLQIPESPLTGSAPVAPEYSDSEIVTTEHWCLRADLGDPPAVGTFTSTGILVGQYPGGSVSATHYWSFIVGQSRTVMAGDDQAVTFRYETFREGDDA